MASLYRVFLAVSIFFVKSIASVEKCKSFLSVLTAKKINNRAQIFLDRISDQHKNH